MLLADRKRLPEALDSKENSFAAVFLGLIAGCLLAFVAFPTFASAVSGPDNLHDSSIAPSDSYQWLNDKEKLAPLEIATSAPTHIKYWSQKVQLKDAGWYRLGVEIQTNDAEAIVTISGKHNQAAVTESSDHWKTVEAFFKVTYPNDIVTVGCGVRGPPGGRGSFRNFGLNRIFGAPPSGARRIDIGSARDAIASPKLGQMPQQDLGGRGGFANAMSKLLRIATTPPSENKALLDVEIAKTPDGNSLIGDLVSIRVLAAILLIAIAILWIDRGYSAGVGVDGSRGFCDREVTKSALVAAFLILTLLGTWLVTRLEYIPGHGLYVVEPHAVAGDEPHYLVMINALLLRRDLELQTVYDDVEEGGPEAGVMARRTKLDRHIIVVNRRTGDRSMGVMQGGINGGFWSRDPRPEFAPSPDVYETSAHPWGFPILIASILTFIRPSANSVERDTGTILMLIAWLGIVATYFVARQVGMSRGWGILAASILFTASPWLPYSRAYFAESAIGTAMVLGLWTLMADLPILAMIAAGASAFMKPPFALVGAGFLVEKLRERRWKDVIKIAAISALGLPFLLMFAYSFWLHRNFFPMSLFLHTLFNSQEGLLLYAPWTIFAFWACARSFPLMSQDVRLSRIIALPLLLYLLTVSSLGRGAGYCYGPRLWVSFMPWLALVTAEAMHRMGRYQLTVCLLALLWGIAIAIPGALRYPQLFGRPVLDAWRSFY